MPIFCKGSNLFGQLHTDDITVTDFIKTFNEGSIIGISYTYSVLHINSNLIIYSNQLETGTEQVIDVLKCGRIVDIALKDDMILILNNFGNIFKTTLKRLDVLDEIPSISTSSDKIININSSSKLNIAYSEQGCLYNIPQKLEFKCKDIVSFSCGREHGIVLDNVGIVYTFGRGSRGQLGHGHLDDEHNPHVVQGLAGIKILQIAAGGWHSCALSEDGDLYSWGWNGNGQLGLGDKSTNFSVLASPHVINFDGNASRNVLKISCGSRHSLALLDDGHLHGCGWNKYKQLKNEDQENFYSFVELHDFSEEVVEELKCGPWNSTVKCQ